MVYTHYDAGSNPVTSTTGELACVFLGHVGERGRLTFGTVVSSLALQLGGKPSEWGIGDNG